MEKKKDVFFEDNWDHYLLLDGCIIVQLSQHVIIYLYRHRFSTLELLSHFVN